MAVTGQELLMVGDMESRKQVPHRWHRSWVCGSGDAVRWFSGDTGDRVEHVKIEPLFPARRGKIGLLGV